MSKCFLVCVFVAATVVATPAEAQIFGGLFCPPEMRQPVVLVPQQIVVIQPEALAYGRDDGQILSGDLLWEGSLQVTEVLVETREIRGFLAGPSGVVENVEIPCSELVFAKLAFPGVFKVSCKTRRAFTLEYGWMKTRSVVDVATYTDINQPLLAPAPEQGFEKSVTPSQPFSGPMLEPIPETAPTPIQIPESVLPPLAPAPTRVVPQSGEKKAEEKAAPRLPRLRQPIAGATVLK